MFVSVVSSKIWCGMGGQQETAYMVVERCIVSVEASRTCYIESSPATLLLPRAAPPTMSSMLACSQRTVKSDSLQPHGGVPWDSSVHGILQARILEWVAISSSRGSSQSRDRTHISCVSKLVLYHWATWEAPTSSKDHHFLFLISALFPLRTK